MTVLAPAELRLLEGARLSPRKRFPGRVRGERLTQARGISVEFSDYRQYAAGDDLRHLDWNVLARFGHAVTKTYRDEEDLAVHILLDASESMAFGEPEKFDAARGLACALGLVALNGGDAVMPRRLGERDTPRGALRGRAAFLRLANWANGVVPEGHASLAEGLRSFVKSRARTGLVALVTDGMDPEVFDALRMLGGRGHEVWLLQVLSAIELDPDLEGDLRLIDSESEVGKDVTVNSLAMREYRARLAEHNGRLLEECRRLGGRYALVPAERPLVQTVRDVFRREGWFE
ncbi:MAG: DUF58 domain-containing protein [Fimbriimonadaceae bacterium]|nr:DUF58 domain-containing protein [Fimbriimonadaceae bacterium]QYK55793.1 MAG: DUF58 domain-containing protein [Fimbriimonadaceae bacterium]